MLYSIASKFVKINETRGTIQNTSSVYTVEVSDNATADSGFLLYPLNKMSFDGEVYLRCAEGGGRALIRVVPFLVNAGGSSSDSATVDDSQIATDEQIDTLLDDVFGNQGGSNVDDSQIATDEQIDQLLDDIFG